MGLDLHDARLAVRSIKIHNRADLERWRKRSKTRLRFLFLSLLIGGAIFAVWGAVLGVRKAQDASVVPLTSAEYWEAIWTGSLVAFCCFSPLVVFACYALLSSGLYHYKQAMNALATQHRVCGSCGVVSLFDDKYIDPSKQKAHTAADLVPYMNVIEQDGKTNVLCDKCLAEDSGMDASETGRDA